MNEIDILKTSCATIIETQNWEITNHFAFSETLPELNLVKTLPRIRCFIIQLWSLLDPFKKNHPDKIIKGIPGMPGRIIPM